ncbi:trigger factor [Candidatus Soleaferrea massiliensis]|uniref:trigger factor n=1 Tax=Candidatus Soleaferrea massiliensis TaxID=1470354 RepID=UPI00058EB5D2|nr:trigger factor [Candidatus Soleaferrea massiliensis]
MSLTKAEKINTNQYCLEIAVDGETFGKAVDQAYRKSVSKINVPGFRKGKAPRGIIEKMYGEGVFYEDAVNNVLPGAFEEAMTESGLEPVEQADVEVMEVSKDGFSFKATFHVKPEVEIGEYKGLEATKTIQPVAGKDIEEEIDKLRKQNGRMVTVEDRDSQNGDTVVIDFEGFVDGVPFEGGKGDGYQLELGSGQFIPGFEDQIIGHKPGDEFEVTVKFPDEYFSKELASKLAVFQTKLHEIRTMELPDVDDEFAKDVSEFDTMDELKADFRTKLEEAREKTATQAVENSLIEQVVSTLKAEIPEVMYENSVNEYLRDFQYRLQSQGMDMKTYLQITNQDEETIRKTFREQAERQVKTRLTLEKVAQLENIEPTEEDIAAECEKLAAQYGVPVENVKQALNVKDIVNDIKMNKAVDLIKESAKITEEVKQEEIQ